MNRIYPIAAYQTAIEAYAFSHKLCENYIIILTQLMSEDYTPELVDDIAGTLGVSRSYIYSLRTKHLTEINRFKGSKVQH